MSDGNLSQPLGMLIIVLISLVVSFFGYHILHLYERWAWIPVLVAIIFTIGCAGSDLAQPAQETPATARRYLGVIALAGGSQITWAMLVGDYCVYMPPTTPRLRLSAYMTFGICFPYTVFQIVPAPLQVQFQPTLPGVPLTLPMASAACLAPSCIKLVVPGNSSYAFSP